MDDKEKIGMLIEQGRWQARELSEIKQDVKALLAFRWRIYGVNAAISAVCAGMVGLVVELLRSHG